MITGNTAANLLQGLSGNDVLTGGSGADTMRAGWTIFSPAAKARVDGGSGIDLPPISTSNAGVTVNLAAGTGSGGHAAGDKLSAIEQVIGSLFNDVITGNADDNLVLANGGDDVLSGLGGFDALQGGNGNDVLYGGDGDDTLDGGDQNDILTGGDGYDTLGGGNGIDTASYAGSDHWVWIDLYSGGGDNDTFTSIENVIGSAYEDVLLGDGGNNVLSGLGGIDLIGGQGGDDVLFGGEGGDALDGGEQNDILVGGAGADVLTGGLGIDRASYATSAAGVTVDLITGIHSGGDAAGDTLDGIEDVEGSQFADVLFGDAGDNQLLGLGENDILIGGAGADVLSGGLGIDRASYGTSTTGVTINLLSGVHLGADAVGDTLDGIEDVEGSAIRRCVCRRHRRQSAAGLGRR